MAYDQSDWEQLEEKFRAISDPHAELYATNFFMGIWDIRSHNESDSSRTERLNDLVGQAGIMANSPPGVDPKNWWLDCLRLEGPNWAFRSRDPVRTFGSIGNLARASAEYCHSLGVAIFKNRSLVRDQADSRLNRHFYPEAMFVEKDPWLRFDEEIRRINDPTVREFDRDGELKCSIRNLSYDLVVPIANSILGGGSKEGLEEFEEQISHTLKKVRATWLKVSKRLKFSKAVTVDPIYARDLEYPFHRVRADFRLLLDHAKERQAVEPKSLANAEAATNQSLNAGVPEGKVRDRTQTFPNRANWLKNELQKRNWSNPAFNRKGGPDAKTTKKMLGGFEVRAGILYLVVTGLNNQKKLPPINCSDIPGN